MRLFDYLFDRENPDDVAEGESYLSSFNEESIQVIKNVCVEPLLIDELPGSNFQFERTGYFCVDPVSTRDVPVFNRSVSLRDTWAKIEKNVKK